MASKTQKNKPAPKKDANLTPEEREALRVAIWRNRDIITELHPLDADDPRRERICSNSRSHKCPGGKAEFVRGSKVLCAACAERISAARKRIENRAKETLDREIERIQKGEITLPDALALYSPKAQASE